MKTTDRQRIWILFAILGGIFGVWASRIPQVRDHAGITSAELGVVLLSLAIGSLLGMPLSVWLASYVRSSSAIFIAVLLLSGGLFAAGSSGGLALTSVSAFVMGVGNGSYGVLLNTLASQHEEGSGTSFLPSCHAIFSISALVLSLTNGVSSIRQINLQLTLAIVSALSLLVAVLASRKLPPLGQASGFKLAIPRGRAVIAAATVAFCVLFAEGVVTDWSAIYLADAHYHVAPGQQALGYSCFAAFMAGGRALGGKLIDRLGEKRVLAVSLVVAGLGYMIAIAGSSLLVTLMGFCLAGAGIANIYPLMITLSSRSVDSVRKQGAIAAVSSIGYFGFLLGPGLVGLVTSQVGIRGGFSVTLIATGLAALIVIACYSSFGSLRKE